ncbi:2'-5' RNA ligase [bacterium]|nr:2'-5' RNA ligase [bacterium]MBP9808874.1 2'-5' RNA ligase [bacterium]
MNDHAAIHPARLFDFDQLIDGLKEAHAKKLVLESSNEDGLLLYVYSSKCVYDQVWNDFTLLARGLILDPRAGKVVATPFPKFFNLGESGGVWPTGAFDTFEKVDGSLIVIFHHNGRWQCATKGAFYSAQALWARARLNEVDQSLLLPGTTYLAEAVYPENRIIVQYQQASLIMLSAYDEAGVEVNYESLQDLTDQIGWRMARRFHYDSLHALADSARALPRDQEGFVVRFSDGSRLKVKGDEYLRLHALLSKVTPLALWEKLAAGDDLDAMRRDLPEEFWSDFDQIRSQLENNLAQLINRVTAFARSIDGLSDKELGLRLGDIESDVRPFIFSYRKEGAQFPGARAKESLLRVIRPTGNSLHGYTPCSALNLLQDS